MLPATPAPTTAKLVTHPLSAPVVLWVTTIRVEVAYPVDGTALPAGVFPIAAVALLLSTCQASAASPALLLPVCTASTPPTAPVAYWGII